MVAYPGDMGLDISLSVARLCCCLHEEKDVEASSSEVGHFPILLIPKQIVAMCIIVMGIQR